MTKKGGGFSDSYDDLLKEVARMSDSDLERTMGAMGALEPGRRKSGGVESLEPGARVEGTVVDIGRGEVLVELDGKTLGVIEEVEFGEEPPSAGDKIQATFERHDRARDLAVLSVGGVRREVFWEEIHAGTMLEGTVTAVNKGGLTLDIKGSRAFLPVSQIELTRVDDLSPYVGRKLRCEVIAFDRGAKNLVVSRRSILERENEAARGKALARLSEGEVLKGTVVRITDHGAFVDLGGLDGLLPANKLRDHLRAKTLREPLVEGQEVQVEVVRVDRERERVSLDFRLLEADAWRRAAEDYAVGEEVTGWVSRRTSAGAVLSLEDGIEGLLPAEHLRLLDEEPRPGAIVKAVVLSIDSTKREILLKPAAKRAANP